MVGHDLLGNDNATQTHQSLQAQCNYVASTGPGNDLDTADVSLLDIESCKLVGGVQKVARALQIA